MVEHLQPDWTITKALDYLSDLYPQDRKSALDALRLAARQARVRITGCRCKWANFDAIEIGEREVIRGIAWVDLAFEVRSSDWAAVQRHSSTMLPLPTMLPPVVAKLLVGKQEAHAPSWWSEFAKSRAAEGWCHLRIYRVDLLSAFPKPDQAANLARFARAVAPPVPASTLSDKRATLPAVCPEPEGTAIEAKRQADTIATPEPQQSAKSPVKPASAVRLCDTENSGSEQIRPRDQKKAETAKRNQEILKEAAQHGLDNKTAAAQKIARSRKMKVPTVYRIITSEARKNNGRNS
jgi:hypothetical protein